MSGPLMVIVGMVVGFGFGYGLMSFVRDLRR